MSSRTLLALLALLVAVPASGAVVYDNTSHPLSSNQFNPGFGTEHGDEITLAGVDRIVTDFEFQYQLGAGSGSARVRFYHNDGPGGEPGSLLYDSGDFALVVTGGTPTPFTLSGLEVAVPDTFTWTVSFESPTSTSIFNFVYDPPVVGSSDNDVYWLRFSGGDWNEAGFGLPDRANFYAEVTALPEPSTALQGLAGAALLMLLGRLRSARRRQR